MLPASVRVFLTHIIFSPALSFPLPQSREILELMRQDCLHRSETYKVSTPCLLARTTREWSSMGLHCALLCRHFTSFGVISFGPRITVVILGRVYFARYFTAVVAAVSDGCVCCAFARIFPENPTLFGSHAAFASCSLPTFCVWENRKSRSCSDCAGIARARLTALSTTMYANLLSRCIPTDTTDMC